MFYLYYLKLWEDPRLDKNTCWQYQIKARKKKELLDELPTVDYSKPIVSKIDYKTAKKFILEYEWLGNMGVSKYYYGLYFENYLVNVVCYGPLVSTSHYNKVFSNEYSKKLYQLCRGASSILAPKWASSFLIAKANKIMYRDYGFRAIIAYADPSAGEIGTIYQASNAFYIGLTSPGGGKTYIIHGKKYDPRTVYHKFGSRKKDYLMQIDPGFKTEPINKKHRYIFLLGTKREKNKLYNKIQSLILPYPKRMV